MDLQDEGSRFAARLHSDALYEPEYRGKYSHSQGDCCRYKYSRNQVREKQCDHIHSYHLLVGSAIYLK